MLPKVGPSLIVTSVPCLFTSVLSWLTTVSLRTWSGGISSGNRCACTRMPTPLPSAWNRTVELLRAWAFDVHLTGMVIVQPKAGSPSVTVFVPMNGTWTTPVAARTPMATAMATNAAMTISLMLRRFGSGSGRLVVPQGGPPPPSVALIDNLCLGCERVGGDLRYLALEHAIEGGGGRADHGGPVARRTHPSHHA